MGVPGLFPFINERYKEAIKHFKLSEGKQNFYDYVYLDSNGLLHGASQFVEGYGKYEMIIKPYAHLSPKERQLKIFKRFFKNILNIIQVIVPTKVLFIAIDGPAPRAKQSQQRERRFGKALESKKIEIYSSKKDELKDDNIGDNSFISSDGSFDSSCITPGTEFMHELSKFMFWKIRSIMNEQVESKSKSKLSFLKNVQIIFSPCTVSGEGEHKCLNFIRNLPKEERTVSTHCLSGPDADLICLALSAHVQKMWLFREDINEDRYPGFVHLIDMSKIRTFLKHDLGFSKETHPDDVSDEFVFLGFFLGNDFLPRIKMFYRLKDGLSFLIEAYFNKEDNYEESKSDEKNLEPKGEEKNNDSDYLLTNLDVLNYTQIYKFVNEVSKYEYKNLEDQVKISQDILESKNTNLKNNKKYVDHTLLKACNIFKEKTGEIAYIELDYVKYRRFYYEKAGINHTNKEEYEKQINQMCYDYFRSVVWTYLYYVKSLPSWDTAYEWHYAPLIKDLSKFLKILSKNKELQFEISHFDLSYPSLPFEQLLAVLPPQSANLLPIEYQSLMLSPTSILVKKGYYPRTFKIDHEGKIKEFEGITHLPFVKYSDIEEAYKKTTELAEYQYHRNELGFPYTFRKAVTNYVSEFTSEYGDIRGCKIHVTKHHDTPKCSVFEITKRVVEVVL